MPVLILSQSKLIKRYKKKAELNKFNKIFVNFEFNIHITSRYLNHRIFLINTIFEMIIKKFIIIIIDFFIIKNIGLNFKNKLFII